MDGRRLLKSVQAVLLHGLLFTFTLFLVLKLHGHGALHSSSWWVIFVPLWLFHVVVARGRFSLPAPSMPHGRYWAPFHAVMATPLLVAFELLLCLYLDSTYVVSLKIVFFPLLALEIAIFVDNVRMCRALMPGDEENMSDEAIWETLPHFWVAISMVFFIAATTFTLLKLSGDVAALGWWDLFINYGVAECFAFIICTEWYNPAIHRHSNPRTPSSSTTSTRYLNWNSGFLASLDEEDQRSRICSLQDIGGHVMKIPLICFQILLFMRLAGTPPSARFIPIPFLFMPLFLLQGAGVLFSVYRLLEKIILLVDGEAGVRSYFRISPVIRDSFGFMHRGSRLLGWWSIDEGSREEQARLYYAETSRYDTLSHDTVKQMPKAKLAEEIWRLQAALCEQSEITKSKQDEFERFQNAIISSIPRSVGENLIGLLTSREEIPNCLRYFLISGKMERKYWYSYGRNFNQKFERSSNATFVALIPKKTGASELKEFRTKSLIGGIYKIIAKLLAERLEKVVNSLVNKHQTAFIEGRQIMDAALIASECVDSRLKGEEAGVV